MCILPLRPGNRVQAAFRVTCSDSIFRHCDTSLLHYLSTHRDLPSTAAAAAVIVVAVVVAAAAGTTFPV